MSAIAVSVIFRRKLYNKLCTSRNFASSKADYATLAVAGGRNASDIILHVSEV